MTWLINKLVFYRINNSRLVFNGNNVNKLAFGKNNGNGEVRFDNNNMKNIKKVGKSKG